MVEVTVFENGQRVLVRRKGQDEPKEAYTVSMTELRHDKKHIGTIFDGLLYVKQVKIEEIRTPDGIYEKFAILTI